MYTFLKSISKKQLIQSELPAFGLSLAIAEFCYKFGSLILECSAFLATWRLVSYALHKVTSARR